VAIGAGFGVATDNIAAGVGVGIGLGLILNAASILKRKPKVKSEDD
jgi:hypothetical protein